MTTHPHLANAPIVEGLIDIRVKPSDDFNAEKLLLIQDRIRSRYPTHTEAMRIAASLQLKAGGAPEQSLTSQKLGYRFDSVERKFVLQVQHGGFTISKLKPYDTWDSLLREAKELWPLYVDIARPQAVTRIATRYINRIELEMTGLDFDDYLSAPPNLPKSLPQAVSEFLSRIVVRDPETNAYMVLIQALEQPNLVTKTIPVIIDIDIFKDVSYPVDSEEYWELLSRFRHLKNRAFFGSITDRTVKLFK